MGSFLLVLLYGTIIIDMLCHYSLKLNHDSYCLIFLYYIILNPTGLCNHSSLFPTFSLFYNNIILIPKFTLSLFIYSPVSLDLTSPGIFLLHGLFHWEKRYCHNLHFLYSLFNTLCSIYRLHQIIVHKCLRIIFHDLNFCFQWIIGHVSVIKRWTYLCLPPLIVFLWKLG